MDVKQSQDDSETFKRPLSTIQNTVGGGLRAKRRFEDEKLPLNESEQIPDTNAINTDCEVKTQTEAVEISTRNREEVKDIQGQNSGLNFKQINKLMGMNQLYNEQKTKPSEGFEFDKSNIITKSPVDREIEYLNGRSGLLSTEYKDVCDKLERLEEEIHDLKRNNQKTSIRNKELQNSILLNSRKFENLEMSITKNVLNREELVNYKIKEMQQKYRTELEEIKFSLKEQIKDAKAFNDEEMPRRIEQLESKKKALQGLLTDLDLKRDEKLNQVRAEIDKQLKATLEEKTKCLEAAEKLLKLKTTELDTLKEYGLELSGKLTRIITETKRLEELTHELQDTGDGYTTKKATLLNTLGYLEKNQKKVQATDEEYTMNLNKTKHIYDETQNKYQNSQNTILALENSSFNIEGKHRVYINLANESLQTGPEKSTIKTQNRSYKFHKVLNQYTNSQILNELKYFIPSSIKSKTNTSIVFYGESMKGLQNEVILKVYKEMLSKFSHATFSCRGVNINEKVFDLFDSMRVIEGYNKSQVMILDEPEVFERILSVQPSTDGVKMFNITVELNEATPKSFDFKVIDLSGVSAIEQINHRLISSIKDTKTFHLGHISDYDDQLLNHLEMAG